MGPAANSAAQLTWGVDRAACQLQMYCTVCQVAAGNLPACACSARRLGQDVSVPAHCSSPRAICTGPDLLLVCLCLLLLAAGPFGTAPRVCQLAEHQHSMSFSSACHTQTGADWRTLRICTCLLCAMVLNKAVTACTGCDGHPRPWASAGHPRPCKGAIQQFSKP